jgi:hypothetical protein
MPTSAGPNISGEENLVFGFDLSDQKNSYLGEPTTNLITNADFTNGTNGWGANQNTTLSVETINNDRFLKIKSNQTTSTPGFLSGNITVSGNATYTLTIRAYKNDNSGIWLYATGNGTGGSDIVWTPAPNGPNPITKTLTTISRTFTTPSDMTILRVGALWANPLTTSEVYVEYMQLELKPRATPFINGTRSVTQGLIDVTGNSTINLSDVSFNSNAIMTFDGTNDKIHTVETTHSHLNSSAIEFVVTPSVINKRMTVGGYRHNEGYSQPTIGMVYIGDDNVFRSSVITAAEVYRSVATSTTVTPNQTCHVILNKDTSTGKLEIFFNGTLHDSTTFSSSTYAQWTTAGSYIGSDYLDFGKSFNTSSGQGWGDDYLNGTIHLFKLYSRTLTSSEVLNNYNNIKRKYGI